MSVMAIMQQGDVIIMLEAMKMETEVKAGRAGSVIDVLVKVGDGCHEMGSPLLTLELTT